MAGQGGGQRQLPGARVFPTAALGRGRGAECSFLDVEKQQAKEVGRQANIRMIGWRGRADSVRTAQWGGKDPPLSLAPPSPPPRVWVPPSLA